MITEAPLPPPRPATATPRPAVTVAPAPATPGSTAVPDISVTSQQDAWVRGRLSAVQAIWGFTSAGKAWQDGYDFRHMPLQPAWYGSFGYRSWAGAGQAVPHSILHELGHSFWGAFPVDGRPELGPARDDDPQEPAVLGAYRADLLEFMRQPPDRFEPLRDRFRNLPNLDSGDYPDLYHFGEADLVYFVGGRLGLIPPILRKYFDSYLADSGVGSGLRDWAGAVAWWLGLTEDERRQAGEVFGLQHFPLGAYEGIASARVGGLDPGLVTVLAGEERQRLLDFAANFDSIKAERAALVDASGVDTGFQFWRTYLREMSDLHRRRPEVLAEQAGDRGRQLGTALDFYLSLDDLGPAAQARRYRERSGDPAVRDLAPLLKGRALLELFPADGDAPAGDGIGPAVSGYAAQLRRLVGMADAALAAGRGDAAAGAQRLAGDLSALTDQELATSVDTVFDTMREADGGTTAAILSLLPDATLLRLLDQRPSAARAGEIPAARLLEAAGVTEGAGESALLSGIALLADNSSGNFAIDEPSEEAVYDLLDRLATTDPAFVLRVFKDTRLRLLPWVRGHSETAAAVLGADPDAAMALLVALDGPEPTAARVVRALAYGSPDTAAALVAGLDAAGRRDLVTATLAAVAYDAYWARLGAGPPGRIESAARLVVALGSALGEEWLDDALTATARRHREAAGAGDVEPGFGTRLRESLSAAADATADGAGARLLSRLAGRLGP